MSIHVFIADKSVIALEGLKTIISRHDAFQIQHSVIDRDAFTELLSNSLTGIMVFDPIALGISPELLQQLMQHQPQLKWLAISQFIFPIELKKYLNIGLQAYLLKECDELEIIEALTAVYKNSQFLCGQIAEKLVNFSDEGSGQLLKKMNCAGIEISAREIEIIRLITEGHSNKEIADKLFISLHTVNTHRKNIMNKLGINNTAGLVMFAIKNEILNPNPFLFS
jgi:DNA-binding NarL/FixJ family response regulator